MHIKKTFGSLLQCFRFFLDGPKEYTSSKLKHWLTESSTPLTFLFHVSGFNKDKFCAQLLSFSVPVNPPPPASRHVDCAASTGLDSPQSLSRTNLGSRLSRVICLENIARGGAFWLRLTILKARYLVYVSFYGIFVVEFNVYITFV